MRLDFMNYDWSAQIQVANIYNRVSRLVNPYIISGCEISQDAKNKMKYIPCFLFRGTCLEEFKNSVNGLSNQELFTTHWERALSYALDKRLCDTPCIVVYKFEINVEDDTHNQRILKSFHDKNQFLDFQVDTCFLSNLKTIIML